MTIQVGDTVTVIASQEAGGQGAEYKVEVIRSLNPGMTPYWVLSRNNREWVFDGPVILRKEEPVV